RLPTGCRRCFRRRRRMREGRGHDRTPRPPRVIVHWRATAALRDHEKLRPLGVRAQERPRQESGLHYIGRRLQTRRTHGHLAFFREVAVQSGGEDDAGRR
ncbi:unnamed protein product, partial [Pylaiella littoralis]